VYYQTGYACHPEERSDRGISVEEVRSVRFEAKARPDVLEDGFGGFAGGQGVLKTYVAPGGGPAEPV